MIPSFDILWIKLIPDLCHLCSAITLARLVVQSTPTTVFLASKPTSCLLYFSLMAQLCKLAYPNANQVTPRMQRRILPGVCNVHLNAAPVSRTTSLET